MPSSRDPHGYAVHIDFDPDGELVAASCTCLDFGKRTAGMGARCCTLRVCKHILAACRHTFVERVAWREPGLAHTLRYARHIYERTRHEDIAQVALNEGLSQDTVRGIFERWGKSARPAWLPACEGARPG